MTGKALLHEWAHARMSKPLMCSIFAVAVTAVLPACTSVESMTATASAQSVTMTNTSNDQFDKKDDLKESAAYNGNWGYAPGNGADPNDEWGRSRGYMDTNSPGCPFNFC